MVEEGGQRSRAGGFRKEMLPLKEEADRSQHLRLLHDEDLVDVAAGHAGGGGGRPGRGRGEGGGGGAGRGEGGGGGGPAAITRAGGAGVPPRQRRPARL